LQQPLTSLEQVQSLNPAAEAILQQAGYFLGRGLAALVNILCPPLLVLHGNLTRFQQHLFPAMERGLSDAALSSCRSRVEVRISAFGSEAAALGAAAAPLENVFLG
jgi:predicted NBD/HSP70 family sugar kinase